LKNESPKDIFLFSGVGLEAGISIELKDHVTGKYAVTAFVPTSLAPPPTSAENFLKIPSNEYIDKKFPLSLKDFELKIGHQYDLVAKYRSSIPKSMNFGLNIFSSEMCPIVSNLLVIEIVKS
jgi:hypothetical protein